MTFDTIYLVAVTAGCIVWAIHNVSVDIIFYRPPDESAERRKKLRHLFSRRTDLLEQSEQTIRGPKRDALLAEARAVEDAIRRLQRIEASLRKAAQGTERLSKSISAPAGPRDRN